MAGHETLSQLAEEIGRTSATDTVTRYVGVNRCRSLQSLTRMTITAPTLMIPLVGTKRISVDEQSYSAGRGDCLILPPLTVFDVENIPDAGTARYLGIAMVFDAVVIEQFRTLYGPIGRFVRRITLRENVS